MELLLWLQSVQNPVMDFLFNGLTVLFNQYVIFIIACIFLWCKDKDFGYKLGFSVFYGGFLNQFLKVLFKIQRPWVLNHNIQPNAIALESATGYSFPSGHTQIAVSGLGTAMLHYKKPVFSILSIFVIFLVAFSRLYLGVHTPLDVVTSLVLSFLVVCLVELFYKKIAATSKKTGLIVVAANILLGICVLVYIMLTEKILDYTLLGDCFKMSGAIAGFSIGWYVEKNFIKIAMNVSKANKIKRFCLGLVIVFVIYAVLKLFFVKVLWWDYVRYAITIFIITAAVPKLFQKLGI